MSGNSGEAGKGMGREVYIGVYKTMTFEAKTLIGDTGGRGTSLGDSIGAFESLLASGNLIQTVDVDGKPVIDVNPEAGQSGD